MGDNWAMRGQYAVLGVSESDLGRVGPHRTELALQVQACRRALADAGLSPRDVDGLFVQPGPYERMPSLLLAEYLGLRVRYADTTMVGGCSNLQQLEHAVAALEAGLCDVALIAYANTPLSSRAARIGGQPEDPRSPRGQFELPYGLPNPVGSYAMVAQRYRHMYGAGDEDFGAVAVSTRQWANLNPVAYHYQCPLTLAQYLESPLISSPLRRDDICLVTDGGGAVVLVRAERARDGPRPPVFILGFASVSRHHYWIPGIDDLLTTGANETGTAAMRRAGITNQDVDVWEIYDAFTVMPILALENLGVISRGEGTSLFREGLTAPGGAMPVNTSGGGLGYGHPGMFGIFLLIEAVRQIRGECGARQIPNAKVAMCHAYGAVLSTESTLVLGRGR